jgi:hypothetical protein
MKDGLKLVIGLILLYLVLTWSYSGYQGQETDSVADRAINNPKVNTYVGK